MSTLRDRVDVLFSSQHGAVAGWQLVAEGWSRSQVDAALRGLRRVFRDVCAHGDLSELGWYRAAALSMGPTGAISHLSALMLMGLRPFKPHDLHVSYEGGYRAPRAGLVPHRRRAPFETRTWAGIPVTSLTQSLKDADLAPHELYRAIEQAEVLGHPLSLPLDAIARLKHAVQGRTRSDTEARFLFLLHEHDLALPKVNQMLNGYEADFHWPDRRVVVEVDGWKHHCEKVNFDDDRHRELVHRAAGFEVVRISAGHVYDRPRLIVAALAEVL